MEIRHFSIYQMPLGTKPFYHAINADIHPVCYSFSEETGRCALLQLGDILQTLPEAYMLLIILGGDETRTHMHRLCKFFKTSEPQASESTSQSYPKILIRFHSLLSCHAAGSGILYWYMDNGWHYNIVGFISETSPLFSVTSKVLLKNYVLSLM